MPILPFADAHVNHGLREGQPIYSGGQILIQRLQRGQHLQCGNGAVAGVVFVEAEDVAAGFAAQLPAVLVQLFQHIAVAHFGAAEFDLELRQGQLHRHIGHHGADYAANQRTSFMTGAGNHINQRIAVVHFALFVHHHQAVAVAIERNAVVGLVLQHGGLQGFGVGGAAFVVDIETVGLVADFDHVCAQLVEHFGRHVITGAVGSVHHQLQPA